MVIRVIMGIPVSTQLWAMLSRKAPTPTVRGLYSGGYNTFDGPVTAFGINIQNLISHQKEKRWKEEEKEGKERKGKGEAGEEKRDIQEGKKEERWQ